MSHPTYKFEGGVGTEIPKGVVSKVARFAFDHEVRLRDNEFITLIDGQFFVVNNGQKTLIEGKWEL